MNAEAAPDTRSGTLAAVGGSLLWGILPVYWKQLAAVPAFELIAHRVTWSIVFLLAILALRGRMSSLRPAGIRTLVENAACALLLAANWTTFVWAVNGGRIVEASLGYFLAPLATVALGWGVLGERLRPGQWAAVGAAGVGVALLVLRVDTIPWVAFALAATWTPYTLLKKRSKLDAVTGLAAESILLAPFAVAFLVAWGGQGALGHADASTHAWLIGTGVVTAVPLLLFSWGARRLPFTTLGILQYVAPTTQFVLGRFVYREPMDDARLVACAFIWTGLAAYLADDVRRRRADVASTRA